MPFCAPSKKKFIERKRMWARFSALSRGSTSISSFLSLKIEQSRSDRRTCETLTYGRGKAQVRVDHGWWLLIDYASTLYVLLRENKSTMSTQLPFRCFKPRNLRYFFTRRHFLQTRNVAQLREKLQNMLGVDWWW